MNFKYHLLPYAGPSSRLSCPQCGRSHCFTPYVDRDGNPVDQEVYGVCDHKSKCGYVKYPPSEEFVPTHRKPMGINMAKKPVCTLPEDIVAKTVIFTRKNSLISFLLGIFPEDTVRHLIELYRMGTTRDGYTVFYQIDKDGRCRAGKIIPYNSETGHRIKDGSVPPVMWVHKKLIQAGVLPEDWVLSQCLFGEHLLSKYPDHTVALVESEKTAIICAAALPEFLWLATGSKQQFNDKLLPLRGRKVVAFPDVDGYSEWCQKAKKYPALNITVSDILERSCTQEQRENKVDIVDLLLEENSFAEISSPENGQISKYFSKECWPEVEALIKDLGLALMVQ